MSKDIISPNLLQVAGEVNFTHVPLEEFGKTDLRAGYHVGDIQKISDFSVAETAICQTVIASVLEEDQQGPDPIIAKTPIGDLLRPRGFNGRLLEGYVALLPFSAERVIALDKRHASHLENYLLDESRLGWRVFFGGLLRKTNAGTAPFVREALYFQKARVVHGSAISRVVASPDPLTWTPIKRSRSGPDAGTAIPGNSGSWMRSRLTCSQRYV